MKVGLPTAVAKNPRPGWRTATAQKESTLGSGECFACSILFNLPKNTPLPGESVFLNLTLCDLIHMALELHSDEGYRSSSTYDGVLSQTYSTSKMH